MSHTFRVGVTRDFLKADGTLGFGDIGLELLDSAAGVEWEFLPDNTSELEAGQVRDYDALLVLAPRVTAKTLDGADRLTVVARFGVGYDTVDVDACTRNNVLLTITPDGVRRPVAVSAIAMLLALSHKLLIKDRLTRAGKWHEKLEHMGIGLTGRTLGLVGLGNIGREIIKMAAPFEMRHMAFDPFVNASDAANLGVELLDLDTLLTTADFVCVCCALVPETHHLLDARRLALMKPTAFLINVARGPIVDQQALTAVLRERRIQGAALDVFEKEPIDADDPLLGLENVILAPHAICWTDELFVGNGRSACQNILDVAAGRAPKYVVNRAVIEQPRLQEKLSQYRTRQESL
jgi:phosphoglycerate dehydrogenase-like enzyme